MVLLPDFLVAFIPFLFVLIHVVCTKIVELSILLWCDLLKFQMSIFVEPFMVRRVRFYERLQRQEERHHRVTQDSRNL
jgi:hypothetical protein